jgi:NADH-quinone oxidoreductase subunit E
MRTRLGKLALLLLAAVGGVVAWQRRNETPPTPPAGDPFLRPAPTPPPARPLDAAAAPGLPGEAVDGGPAAEAGLVERGQDEGGLPGPRGPADGSDDLPGGAGADDLKVITGIGPKLERQLHAEGITTYAQLAALSDDDVARLEATFGGVAGRIRRDDWIGQAKRLAQR